MQNMQSAQNMQNVQNSQPITNMQVTPPMQSMQVPPMMNLQHKSWMHPVSFWSVTTEGDSEGHSVKDLGTFYGHYVDIALALADKACYALHFERINEEDLKLPIMQTRDNVLIAFRDSSGIKSDCMATSIRSAISDSGASVYAGMWEGYVSIQRAETEEMKKTKALNKLRNTLSPEEMALLGL